MKSLPSKLIKKVEDQRIINSLHLLSELLVLQNISVIPELLNSNVHQLLRLVLVSRDQNVRHGAVLDLHILHLVAEQLEEAVKVVFVRDVSHHLDVLLLVEDKVSGVEVGDHGLEGDLVYLLDEDLSQLSLPHLAEDHGTEDGRPEWEILE